MSPELESQLAEDLHAMRSLLEELAEGLRPLVAKARPSGLLGRMSTKARG